MRTMILSSINERTNKKNHNTIAKYGELTLNTIHSNDNLTHIILITFRNFYFAFA